MLHVVVVLQIGLGFEPHECHSNLVELLDCFNLLLRDADLLIADREVGANLLFVQYLSCLFAKKPLGASKLFVVDSINLARPWFLGWHDRRVK